MASFEENLLETLDRPVRLRGCDCPGCDRPGDYRAPKSRDHLNDYYWFCLDHVRDYNRQWDYFAGMNADEIEEHIRAAGVWERPSWPMGEWRVREQQVRDEVQHAFFTAAGNPQASAPPMPKAEREALAVLELSHPVTLTAIKAQYRLLVKRHHPDLHGGSREAEEKFKSINQAFAVLKKLFEADPTADL